MMKKVNKKFIIGGGISGLVFQFYNPEFTIITPDIGGIYNSYVVIIHDTVETRKLLSDLGYENVDKLHKRDYMGYYNNGWISEELTPDLSLLLIQKKMSKWNELVDTSFIPKSYEMSTRGSKTVNYMNVLDIEPHEIITKLNDKHGPILNGFVTKVTDKILTYKERWEGPEVELEYDELVTTIPAPLFWKAYGEERNYHAMSITNVITKVKPKEFNDKFTTTYYGHGVPFTRIAHLDGVYAIEFSGDITKEEFEQLYPEYPVEKIIPIKQGRIFQEDNISPQKNIKFLGRFGEWKFGITSEHVIKSSIDYKNEKTKNHSKEH